MKIYKTLNTIRYGIKLLGDNMVQFITEKKNSHTLEWEIINTLELTKEEIIVAHEMINNDL